MTAAATTPATINVALIGNPNTGKSTLFNALSGGRVRTGNYPGVTVEKKSGRAEFHGRQFKLIDLPGTYSLSPQSLDEQISRDVLLHRLPELPPPDLIVVVVDASNLQRNLYYATQVIEMGDRILAITQRGAPDRYEELLSGLIEFLEVAKTESKSYRIERERTRRR